MNRDLAKAARMAAKHRPSVSLRQALPWLGPLSAVSSSLSLKNFSFEESIH